MAKYARLQLLLKDDPDIDLSFYPAHLLHLRSILSDWVEKQDLEELLFDTNCDVLCKQLHEEAIALLHDKAKDSQLAGFQIHIRTIISDLKKAYETDPIKFVQDLFDALNKEDQLTDSMAYQPMVIDGATAFQSLDQLTRFINVCCESTKKIMDVVNTAATVLNNWADDIESKSTVPRDVFGNGECVKPPYEILQRLKKNFGLHMPKLTDNLGRAIAALNPHIKQWKLHQMYQCVSRRPANGPILMPEQVETLCVKMCECVSHLHRCVVSNELQRMDSVRDHNAAPGIATISITANFEPTIRSLINQIFESFLVVIEQPPVTMMIEKEKGTKDKSDDTNSSKKFQTTIGILGGNGFRDIGLQILEVEIYLAHNQDLSKCIYNNQKPKDAFQILRDKPARRTQSRNYDSPTLPYQRTYKSLRVEGYRRNESKNVYKQLYHVVYDIKFQIPFPVMMEFSAQTYSLPIIVRTGAVQASEHVGVLLWHSFSSPNVFDLNAEVANSMTVSQVIEMINERILYIGGRGLQQYEIQFLQDRIKMAMTVKGDRNGNSDSITLDAFIKDKVVLPSQGSRQEKDTMSFSLWRWIHAIINLLEGDLKQPWVDDIVYGFASREQCILALQNEPDGTFLLRFSESFLSGNYINSKGGLAVVVKTGGKVGFPPPLVSEDIEKEGLAKLFRNIGEGGQGHCLFLYGSNTDLETLENRYPPACPDAQGPQSNRYLGWKKVEVIVPQNQDHASNMGTPNSHNGHGTMQPDPRNQPKKAKRRATRPKPDPVTINTKQYRATGPWSPAESTSSAQSPLSMPMSPTNGEFQAVGYQHHVQRQLSSSSYDSPPTPTNIPTPVFAQLNLNKTISNQQDIMELELITPGEYFFVDGGAAETGANSDVVNLTSLGLSSGIIVSTGGSNQMIVQQNLSMNLPQDGTPSNFLLSNMESMNLMLDNDAEPFTIEDLQQLQDYADSANQ